MSGKGTTGYCIGRPDGTILQVGDIKAKDYETRLEYHDTVITLALSSDCDVVVCENFKLYAHKALQQSYSELETPRIIGALEYCCWLKQKPLYFQMASDVKSRFSDEVLEHKKIITNEKNRYYYKGIVINDHTRDAIRHFLYFTKYGLKKYKIER